MTERLTQAVSSTLGGLTGQEAEDKFTSTSGAPLAGVPTKDVPSAGPVSRGRLEAFDSEILT